MQTLSQNIFSYLHFFFFFSWRRFFKPLFEWCSFVGFAESSACTSPLAFSIGCHNNNDNTYHSITLTLTIIVHRYHVSDNKIIITYLSAITRQILPLFHICDQMLGHCAILFCLVFMFNVKLTCFSQINVNRPINNKTLFVTACNVETFHH